MGFGAGGSEVGELGEGDEMMEDNYHRGGGKK